jgi:hypothetical protein
VTVAAPCKERRARDDGVSSYIKFYLIFNAIFAKINLDRLFRINAYNHPSFLEEMFYG